MSALMRIGPDSFVIPDLPKPGVVPAAVEHAARRFAVAFGYA
jgi:hypothetical protein